MNIKKMLLKYFDRNQNKKIDWWECLDIIIHAIILLLFFAGFVVWLLK